MSMFHVAQVFGGVGIGKRPVRLYIKAIIMSCCTTLVHFTKCARGASPFAVSASKRRRRERGRRDVVGFGLKALRGEVLVDTRSVTVSFARVA